jgi:exonuclease VII small subunit
MFGIMDALPEASQHEDVMAHSAYQLNASMERVRQARQLLHEASDRLTQTRQEVEQDPRIERVRRARERLHVANQQLAQAREQVDGDHPRHAVGPATADHAVKARDTP